MDILREFRRTDVQEDDLEKRAKKKKRYEERVNNTSEIKKGEKQP